MSTTSKCLDGAALITAGLSHYYGWDTQGKISINIFRGMQFFCAASCIDHIARLMLPNNVALKPTPILQGIVSAGLEEAGYAGVLLTEGNKWVIPRFLVSLITGMTAARAFIEIPKGAKPFTLDVKIGFLWAVTREILLRWIPKPYSQALLIGADSAVFAFIEIEPLKSEPNQVRLYKGLTAFFFRAIGTIAALRVGIGASLTQHVFFNVSRNI